MPGANDAKRSAVEGIDRALDDVEAPGSHRRRERLVLARIAGRADLARGFCAIELAEDVVSRERALVARVEAEDVDHVGAQPSERRLDAESDHVASPVRDSGNAVAALGGQHHAVATRCERAPQSLHRAAIARCRVEQRHTQLERPAHERIRVAVAEATVSERPGAESERGDLEPRRAERALGHAIKARVGRQPHRLRCGCPRRGCGRQPGSPRRRASLRHRSR